MKYQTNIKFNSQIKDILNNHEQYYLNLSKLLNIESDEPIKAYFSNKSQMIEIIIQHLIDHNILVKDENFES